MAFPVLRHRIFTNFNADAEGVDVEQVIEKIVATIPEPTYGEGVAAHARVPPCRSVPPPAAAKSSVRPRRPQRLCRSRRQPVRSPLPSRNRRLRRPCRNPLRNRTLRQPCPSPSPSPSPSRNRSFRRLCLKANLNTRILLPAARSPCPSGPWPRPAGLRRATSRLCRRHLRAPTPCRRRAATRRPAGQLRSASGQPALRTYAAAAVKANQGGQEKALWLRAAICKLKPSLEVSLLHISGELA